MQKTILQTAKTVAWIACILGGFGSFMQWLGIKPKDLAMTQTITIPHVLWLLLAVALFAIGIGGSLWAGVLQRIEIKRLKSGLLATGTTLEVMLPPTTEWFSPLQVEALQLSRDIRAYLNECGEKPGLLKPGSSENLARIDERMKWSMRLEAGYKLRFETRDKEIDLKFSEKGISVRTSANPPRYINERYYEWAEELVALAYKVEGIALSVGTSQWNP